MSQTTKQTSAPSTADGADGEIVIQRVREPRQDGDVRILVDRLWPRGVSKEKADLDGWAKEAAPSTELRQAFHADELTFRQFSQRYRHELHESEGFEELAQTVRDAVGKRASQRVTLLIAADPSKHNHAEVLRDELVKSLDDLDLKTP